MGFVDLLRRWFGSRPSLGDGATPRPSEPSRNPLAPSSSQRSRRSVTPAGSDSKPDERRRGPPLERGDSLPRPPSAGTSTQPARGMASPAAAPPPTRATIPRPPAPTPVAPPVPTAGPDSRDRRAELPTLYGTRRQSTPPVASGPLLPNGVAFREPLPPIAVQEAVIASLRQRARPALLTGEFELDRFSVAGHQVEVRWTRFDSGTLAAVVQVSSPS